MKLTDALLGEHGAFHALFDQIEEMASVAGNAAQTGRAAAILAAVVGSHAALEEELLFLELEPYLGIDGPLVVMRAEHEEIERGLKRIEDARNSDEAYEWLRETIIVARSHFQKEEKVLFALARQVLDDETLTRLGNAWADKRHVNIG